MSDTPFIKYIVITEWRACETVVVRTSDGEPVTMRTDDLGDLVFAEAERPKWEPCPRCGK